MKTSILMMLMVVSIALRTSAQNIEWIVPKPSGEDFEKIYFYDDNLGFLYGLSSTIARTTDCGESWKLIEGHQFGEIIMTSKTDGIATPYSDFLDIDSTAFLYKTQDGGLNWTRITHAALPNKFEEKVFALDLQLLDEKHLFLLAGSGKSEFCYLMVSGDKGKTWDVISNIPNPMSIYSSESYRARSFDYGIRLSMLNITTGVVWYNDMIYVTTNGGSTFNIDTTSRSFMWNIPKPFVRKTGNYLVAAVGFRSFYYTQDTTWHKLPIDELIVRDIKIVNDKIYIQIPHPKRFYLSIVLSAPFPACKPLTQLEDLICTEFDLLSDGRIISVGDTGLLQRLSFSKWSPDEGITGGFKSPFGFSLYIENAIAAGQKSVFLSSAGAFDPEHAYGLPSAYVSTDYGHSWTGFLDSEFAEQNGWGHCLIQKIAAYDEYNIAISVQSAKDAESFEDLKRVLYISSDGGESWTPTIQDRHPLEVVCVSRDTAIIVPEWHDRFYRTFDGYQSWDTLYRPDKKKDMNFEHYQYNSGRLFFYDESILVYSDNFGETWNHTNRAVEDLQFWNETEGYLTYNAKGYKVIVFTEDNGKTWGNENNTIEISGIYSFVVFLDRNVGVAFRDFIWNMPRVSKIIRTIDGGDTWEHYGYTLSNLRYFNVKRIENSVAWVSGSSGLFKLTSDNITSISDNIEFIPAPGEYTLHNNYPNPFNPETRIEYHLPEAAEVALTVYDITGAKVRELQSGWMQSGVHLALWDGRTSSGAEAASGVYFCRITAKATGGTTPDFVKTIKLLLQK